MNEIEKLNKKHSTEIQKLENLLKKNSYEKASKKKSFDTEEFKKFYDHNKNSNQKLKFENQSLLKNDENKKEKIKNFEKKIEELGGKLNDEIKKNAENT